MRRVVIVGSSGSGKSTFARELGRILQIPVFHFDALYWKAGWVPASDAEQQALERKLETTESWIFDGVPRAMLEKRFSAADTIFFFDLPTALCLWRGIRRRLLPPRTPPRYWPAGCKPHFDLQSLGWIKNYRRDDRPAVLAALDRHREGRQIVVLQRRSDPGVFLTSISEGKA